MKCDQLEALWIDALEGRLDAAARDELEAHLAACPACRAEAARVEALWQRLGEWPEEVPGAQVSARFHAMLAAAEARQARQAAPALGFGAGAGGSRWAAAAALMAAGLALGWLVPSPFRGEASSAELQNEVRALTRLVTVALLERPLASERLQAASYVQRAEGFDPELAAAWLSALREDDNVNVRLAAVDALATCYRAAPASERERLRATLVAATPEQPSPLVQVALVEWLANLGGPTRGTADPDLRRLADDQRLAPATREWLARRLGLSANT